VINRKHLARGVMLEDEKEKHNEEEEEKHMLVSFPGSFAKRIV